MAKVLEARLEDATPPSDPLPSRFDLELSDEELDHVAGGLERAYLDLDRADPPPSRE